MTLKSRLCDYSHACIRLKGTFPNTAVGTVVAANNNDIEVVFKNCGPFTDCISEINNALQDNVNNIDVVMLMYSLIAAQQSGFIVKYV